MSCAGSVVVRVPGSLRSRAVPVRFGSAVGRELHLATNARAESGAARCGRG